MAHEIKIPSVGESISEGTLAQWLKKNGDAVKTGDLIAVVDTEKASQDLTAESDGELEILVQAGTDVKIGELIGRIKDSSNGVAAVAEKPVAVSAAPEKKAAAAMSAPEPSGASQSFDIIVPPAGESISEGTIAQWLKADGEHVNKGDNLVVIDTEKASSDIQAEASGTLTILSQAGQDVKIGAVIGKLTSSGESPVVDASNKAADQHTALHVASPQPVPGMGQPSDQVPEVEAKAAVAEHRPAVAPEAGQAKASPAAAADARETTQPARDASPGAAPTGDQPVTREPMSRMRRTIAAHLLKARNETAMLTTFAEVDMSAIMELRKNHQDSFVKKHGIKLGFMSFFIKACVDGLGKFPLVNASLEGNDILYHHYVNMAIAVSTERGLAVPVIKNAQELSFADLEKQLVELAKMARSGRIPLEQLKGGTFTITNGGVFGSLLSTPLINPPQVAILGMHSIQERPIVIDGKIEVRPMMNLALSYDHRLIDGKEAVQFLVHVRDRIAAPGRLLLGI